LHNDDALGFENFILLKSALAEYEWKYNGLS
jgi:hypothetical protein